MTLRNLIIRAEIKILLKHFPFQVADILAEQGKHIHANPKPKKEQEAKP